MMIALGLMISTWKREKELNDKFLRRFGPNSAYQHHPGVYKFQLMSALYAWCFIHTGLYTALIPWLRTEHFQHLWISLLYALLVTTWPLYGCIVLPVAVVWFDKKLRAAAKGHIRDLRNSCTHPIPQLI